MSTVKTYMHTKVPDGSKYYYLGIYYKVKDGELLHYFKGNDKWGASDYSGLCSLLEGGGIELPQEPETFVPVVGEECELTPHNAMWGFSNGDTVRCVVVGLHLDWIVVAQEHCAPITTRLDKCDLSPVKSEREEVIDLAIKTVNCAPDDSLEGWLNALYLFGMLVMPDSDKC